MEIVNHAVPSTLMNWVDGGGGPCGNLNVFILGAPLFRFVFRFVDFMSY